ncbi:MAG: FxsA family protein [Nocardioides sp.]|nr:FxsA family protein [Nocardioides sp.]
MRSRRFPLWLLALAFVAVPLLEVYLIIQVGKVIGAWWTIGLLVLAGVVGSWLVRHEGSRAWAALRDALASGRMPAREIADGALILIGGTLMLTPGFLSDVVGMAMILPFTRPWGRRVLTGIVARRLVVVQTARRPGPQAGGPVIRGDVVD